ncbi:MAG TPA: LLM class flavin-dependent oxidoreductase [Candidatus Binataceae bacterium]|jgi:alkanesulfonate monooxygenase SsuD/methylene tetrahydromethanopterin reductase-like flavin-dependent oxidoreductase (luciferase family)|nr:LLM class flavin-dependent oxidoreductase [Candidatus Binataceae bacterium]
MLKAGYFPCTQDPPRGENIGKVLREAIVEAQVAEQSGFDSCLFSEHHQQEDAYIPNVILMAGMVGVNTTKIRVGTCVTLIPLWHPVHAAEDAAIVDQITGGRMILSVGVGYQERDFSAFGLSISERAGRSEEGVEVVKKCWTEERFSYRGKFYQLDNVMITPKPFQKPRPPIWMAAWTNVGLKRAARIADAWITSPLEHVQVIKQFANLYREETRKQGKTPYLVLMRDVLVSDSWEAARRESEPLMYTHRFYFRNNGYAMDDVIKNVKSEEQWTFDVAAPNRFIAGSPKDCLQQLQMWQKEVQPDYLVLRMRHPGGPSHERVKQAISTFGREVLPKL